MNALGLGGRFAIAGFAALAAGGCAGQGRPGAARAGGVYLAALPGVQ